MSAAATAAGYLYASGRLTGKPVRTDQGGGAKVPVRSTALATSEPMRRCSVCAQRITRSLWEPHMLIAHPEIRGNQIG